MHEGVAAFIVEQQRVLLGKRSPTRAFAPGIWDVFGGHTEAGESWEQTLQRELHEELGITPQTWEYMDTLTDAEDSKYGAAQFHFFLVAKWEGIPTNMQPEEHTLIQWFSLDDVLQIDLPHPGYYRLLSAIRSRLESKES